jgi:RNA polymerase-binding protein DksA
MRLTVPAALSAEEIARCSRELRRDRERCVLQLMQAGMPATLFAVNATPEVSDTKDEAVQEQLEGTRREQVDRLTGNLAQIDAALRRIETGAYGTCQSCGNPIGTPRLLAEPTAVRCHHCQEALERQRSTGSGRNSP